MLKNLKKKKNNKGFTLVELLVVIAIIGVLAVVAVPSLLKNVEKSKVAKLEADYNVIKTAVTSYYVDYNEYPLATGADDANSVDKKLEDYMEPSTKPFGGTYILEADADKKVTSDLHLKGVSITPSALQKLQTDLGDSKVKASAVANGKHANVVIRLSGEGEPVAKTN